METLHARAVELLNRGFNVREIAGLLGVARGTITVIKHRNLGYVPPKILLKRKQKDEAKALRLEEIRRTLLINLGEGYFARIDADDIELLSRFTWSAHHENDRIYARARYKRSTGGDGQIITMHRLIMGFPDLDVDHKNNDGLDNRKENLRIATRQQNNFNKLRKNTGTNFVGVYLYKRTGHWTGQIRDPNGKRVSIGYHKTDYEAALVRESLAKSLHGEFAKLNFQHELQLPQKIKLGGRDR